MSRYFSITHNRDIDKYIIPSLIGVASFITIKSLISIISQSIKSKKITETRKSTRSERDAKIEKFIKENQGKVSEEKQSEIISHDINALTQMIKDRKYTCEEVLITYAIRAGTIGKELNLIADVDFENALTHAKRADKDIVEGKELGPLHGIPVSFYEQISVKGLLTTCGYTSYSKKYIPYDSLIVANLRKKGAIPFVKSNIPQGFMALEASNFLWGKSENPWNRSKTTGGSNGGETGLVAARCSPLGMGSDLFGSIRVPCSFCGLYGFKPTASRNSKHGAITYNGTNFVGFQPVVTSWGPICRSVDDAILVSKSLTGTFEDDIYTNNKSFDEESFNKVIHRNEVKIGYIMDVEECPTAPAIKEAMNDAINKLRSKGYTLVEFPMKQFEEFIQLGMALMANSETVELVDRELNGEEMGVYYKSLFYLTKKSDWCLKIMAALKFMIGEKRQAKVISNFKNMNKSEYIDHTRRYLELKYQFINFWKDQKFDAVIAPVFPIPALDFGVAHKLLPYNHFSYLFNFIDMPAGTIPMWLNTSSGTAYEDNHNDELTRYLKENMKTSTGLPISIQVAALPNQDEWVLRMMQEIDSFYRFDKKYSHEVLKTLSFKKISS